MKYRSCFSPGYFPLKIAYRKLPNQNDRNLHIIIPNFIKLSILYFHIILCLRDFIGQFITHDNLQCKQNLREVFCFEFVFVDVFFCFDFFSKYF